jgi:hypothetical protein
VRGLFCAAITVAALSLAACGGGSVQPPPPSGPFSNASLHGQYAFSMSGVELNGAYFARIGSFTADGSGNITGGLEDVLNLSTGQTPSVVSFTGGNYQVQSNGRGQIVLTAASGGRLQLSMMMQSTSTGFLVQTDLEATNTGTFNLQTSADFTTAALASPYVFATSGVSFAGQNAAPIGLVGEITVDGNGSITGGVMDTNDGNATAPSGATAIAPGTYALDTTNGNGTNFGRGTMAFNGRTFAFYIMDTTHFELLEEDALGGSAGSALQQVGAIPTQNAEFMGSFAYLIGGVSALGSQGPVTRVARFTADGNGGLGTISLDDNNDGSYTHISQGGNISAASYAIDTANAGSGRGTFTFTDSGAGTFSDVFYMVSPTRAMVEETSKGIIGTGPMYAQAAGPFTLAGSVGSFVTGWSGVQLGSNSAVAFEEDFVAQYMLTSASSSNIAGGVDYVELGLSSKTLFTNVALGGTLTINGDGTMNNHYKFAVNGTPSITVNFQAYFVNSATVLLVCSDGTRTTSGVIQQQQ